MGSRARGAFDLLPVEQTSMEGWLQHTPRHSAHTLPALAIPPGSPCPAQNAAAAPCPTPSGTPKNINPASVQKPDISSTPGQRDVSRSVWYHLRDGAVQEQTLELGWASLLSPGGTGQLVKCLWSSNQALTAPRAWC